MTDYNEIISIKGKINNIEFLIKDWNGGEKTYLIYWVKIDLTINANSQNDIVKNIISSKKEHLKILSFVSESSGLRADLDGFNKFAKGDIVEIEVRKTELKKYINNKTEDILIKTIKAL